jgi:hypothetical protein
MDKVLQRAIQENEINVKSKAASVGVKVGSDGLGLVRLHKVWVVPDPQCDNITPHFSHRNSS